MNESESVVSSNFVEQAKQLLGKLLRVSVSDGRTLEGEFICLDREFNIVLGNAFEFTSSSSNENSDRRPLGITMIPGAHIKSVFIQNHVNET